LFLKVHATKRPTVRIECNIILPQVAVETDPCKFISAEHTRKKPSLILYEFRINYKKPTEFRFMEEHTWHGYQAKAAEHPHYAGAIAARTLSIHALRLQVSGGAEEVNVIDFGVLVVTGVCCML